MHTQPHSRHATGGVGGGTKSGRPPVPFFENQKKCVALRKKGPDCAHLSLKFSIHNVVLIAYRRKILIEYRRKNSKMFPCGTFFSCVFDEIFIGVT